MGRAYWLVLPALALSWFVVHEARADDSPSLGDLTITPERVDPGDAVWFLVGVHSQDPLAAMSVALEREGGGPGLRFSTRLDPPVEASTNPVFVELPPHTLPGRYHVVWAGALTTTGVWGSASYPLSTLIVGDAAAHVDVTPPQLRGVRLLRASIHPGESFPLNVSLQDESGVGRMFTSVHDSAQHEAFYGDVTAGSDAGFQVPSLTQPGEYHLAWLSAIDANENGGAAPVDNASFFVGWEPTPPQNLTATPKPMEGAVAIAWVASDGRGLPIKEYQVHRTDARGTKGVIGTTRATSFNDTGCALGKSCVYSVVAVNDVGKSNASAAARADGAAVLPSQGAHQDGWSHEDIAVESVTSPPRDLPSIESLLGNLADIQINGNDSNHTTTRVDAPVGSHTLALRGTTPVPIDLGLRRDVTGMSGHVPPVEASAHVARWYDPEVVTCAAKLDSTCLLLIEDPVAYPPDGHRDSEAEEVAIQVDIGNMHVEADRAVVVGLGMVPD